MNAKGLLQLFVTIVLLLAALFPISVNAAPTVLYAQPGGLISGACDSWANACDLQYALASAVAGQEIWAAAGVYKPGTARTDTFQLKSGVGLYGGFSGVETTRDQRNWQTNKTILSGDIDNNDINTDGNFIAETITDIQGNNTYNVVNSSGTGNTAVLDGFIITAGKANGGNYVGGGMYNYNGSPQLANINFSANLADGSGGGIFSYDGTPTLTNITFSNNSTIHGYCGGMLNSRGTLMNVIFSGNSAQYGQGGGMCNLGSGQLTNVLFYANSAGAGEGGGIYNFEYSWVTMRNVTFYANSAFFGRAMSNGPYSYVFVNNSILWSNSATGSEIYNFIGASSNVTNSDIKGGWTGTGNIDADPLFVDPAKGDLHLQPGSPVIDSGTNDGCPSSDLDGISRPKDGNGDGIATCDMGAYEFVSPVITIKIDIKPGSSTNPINLGANGVIPIAVLTTAEFKASDLDPATVLFAGAPPLRWSKQDVDYDGDMDLLFHFDVQKLQLTQSSVEASLTGKTYTGMSVKGTDKIKIVPKPVSYP